MSVKLTEFAGASAYK